MAMKGNAIHVGAYDCFSNALHCFQYVLGLFQKAKSGKQPVHKQSSTHMDSWTELDHIVYQRVVYMDDSSRREFGTPL